MNSKTFTRGVLIAAAGALMTACDGNKYTVEGQITEAEDSLLLFEHMSLTGPTVIDSARLGKAGDFKFKAEAAESPEFYRLRIAGQVINLSADSTETVTVKAAYPTMATAYTVDGSDECQKIQELAYMQIKLQDQAFKMEKETGWSRQENRDSMLRLLTAYKERVKNEYIYKDPKAASSYFALFQTIGGYLIFDPQNNADDIRTFAAVATNWDSYYPNSLRGENLHNITLEGMKAVRAQKARSEQTIPAEKVVDAGVIEIALEDNKGGIQRLTATKGKVVLLDFHVFAADYSPQRILQLRELYNKYHSRGLEIFQVSFDPDEHFWKQQTANLPWICVRDPQSIESSLIVTYNLQQLPDYFLINRNNELTVRAAQIGKEGVEKAIEKLL